MRIFFVTNNYTPYTGGVVQSITATTQALRAQGHDVYIITLNFLQAHHDDPEYVIRITCPLKFMYKKNHMAIPWRPTNAIIDLIKKYNPDIIHIHHPFLLGSSALRAAQKYNIPVVFTYHTLYEHYTHYVPLPQKWTLSLMHNTIRRFCNKVDAIIAPSASIKNYLQLDKIITPITIIASPLRECFSSLIDHKTKTKESDFFELLLVTRFVPEKNIPFVLKVMQLLPHNFRLTLAGYGNDTEKLQKLAFNTLQLSPERIHFIHKPDQKKLLELYRKAYLFIFPSQTDTQGIVLAESMSQAVPVIALDGPGQRDIIINGINGFITTNKEETAEIILQISADKELYNHLVSGAQKTSLNYNAQIITQNLITLYLTMKHNQ